MLLREGAVAILGIGLAYLVYEILSRRWLALLIFHTLSATYRVFVVTLLVLAWLGQAEQREILTWCSEFSAVTRCTLVLLVLMMAPSFDTTLATMADVVSVLWRGKL